MNSSPIIEGSPSCRTHSATKLDTGSSRPVASSTLVHVDLDRTLFAVVEEPGGDQGKPSKLMP